MDYRKHYNYLITRAKTRIISSSKERHHIVPKCIGGTEDPSNLVDLTLREHYIAHILLAKIYGGTLWHAVNLMGRKKQYTNCHYERSRIEHSKLLSEQNKRTKIKPKENRHYKCTNCGKDLVYSEFCHHIPKEHYYCDATCRNQYIAKVRPSQIGRKHNRTAPAWNKGISNPQAAENARKGAAKLSAKVQGRTRLYKEDGSWTWQYPKK
jgi:hypothetical protein